MKKKSVISIVSQQVMVWLHEPKCSLRPEYGQKRFDAFLAKNSNLPLALQGILRVWHPRLGPKWSANGHVPTTLTKAAARVATVELKDIPEYGF